MNDNLNQGIVGGSQYSEEADSENEDRPIFYWALLDRFAFRVAMPSFLISLIFHILITVGAGWFFLGGSTIPVITFEASNSPTSENELELDSPDLEDSSDQLEATEDLEQSMAEAIEQQVVETDIVQPTETTEITPDVVDPALNLSETGSVSAETTAASVSGVKGIDGRKGANRKALAVRGGGTEASENAVEMGLAWLARHQNDDGGWDLDHQHVPKKSTKRRSPNPGVRGMRIGATGLAVLPFLGAGYTHTEGKYRKVVGRGLAYMIASARGRINAQEGLAFYESNLTGGVGNMYSHTLATLCLCEAYTLTKDPKLRPICEAAVRHIVYFQDPNKGGWKYHPRSGSDTSVTGWVVLAIKSAELAGIKVPNETKLKATRFLNSVQSDNGASYGYESQAARPGATLRAVGILCRMYLGWKKDRPPLVQAVDRLSNTGPDTRYFPPNSPKASANIYYNYYATMVMRQYGGDKWRKWNPVMRDYLVEKQAKNGAKKGSWFIRNNSQSACEIGGRLYVTSLAILTLEVYYRYPPIYKTDPNPGIDDFALD